MDSFKALKNTVENFMKNFDYKSRIPKDPVLYVRRYTHKKDLEIAGLIASSFAYGGVKGILKSLNVIFSKMGSSPYSFLMEWDGNGFEGFYHRFHKEGDLKTLLWCIKKVLEKWGSINNLFLEGYKNHDISKALEHFSKTFREISTYSPFPHPFFEHFFPLPSKGSPVKRLCLYLRWMNRKDNVDPGGWQGVKKSDLIIPVDTHIAKIGKALNLTHLKTLSWKMAVEITNSLKKMDPEDPLKYDFPLCHMGISKMCNGIYHPQKCKNCSFLEVCMHGLKRTPS